MNHKQIDHLKLIDCYLMGKLTAEEAADFEEHFVDCPQCVARLHTTESFLQDLRLVAAEQAAQAAPRQPGQAWPDYLHRFSRGPLALAAACLLIVAVATAIFVSHYTRRLRAERDQAKTLSEQWQRRYEEERESALESARRHQVAESQQAEQLSALASKLKAEQALQMQEKAGIGRWAHSAGNLSLFVLDAVRSSEPSGSEAINSVTLPRSSQIFLLSIPLVEGVRFDDYRITIFDVRHRRVWASRPLRPDQDDALTMPFKTDFFRPGRYSLILNGVKNGGERELVAQFPLLIKRSR